VKEGWKTEFFGDVCKIVGGSQPPKKEFIYEPKEGYTRLIQVRDYKTDKYITYIPTQKTKKFCAKTDLMIGRYGPPIFGIFRGLEGAYNVALMKAIPDESKLDKEYFYWFLHTRNLVQFVERTSKRAAGQDGVRKDRLYSYPVPIPPLPEQKRIVTILDEAFAGINKAIANTEKNLVNAHELFDSYLNNITYERKPLSSFVDIKTGKLNANAAVEGGKYPFFTCSREVSEINTHAFDCEAILLAGNNASGDFNVKHYKGKFNAYQRTYVITIKNNNDYLYRFLYFQLMKSLKELKNSSVGAGTKFLKLGMIQNLLVSAPPIDEQKKILINLEGILSSTENLQSIYQQKLAALQELKQSILQKAFKGDLTADYTQKQVNG